MKSRRPSPTPVDFVKRFPTVVLIAFVLVSCVGCDQITKDLARDRLRSSGPVTLIEDAIHLVYAENPGVAFGLGADLPDDVRFWTFSVGITLVLLGISAVAYLRRHQGRLYLFGSTLLVAGGVSNLIDRFLNDGHVVDFMMISLGSVSTAVFNVADVLVLSGAVTIIASAMTAGRRLVAAAEHERAA